MVYYYVLVDRLSYHYILTAFFSPVHACATGVKQCLLSVCVSSKNIEKCFKQGRKGIYRCHSQRKTISIIILGRFCTSYKFRRFFTLLFQILPIISFVAPPPSKSHMVVMVSNATHTPKCENTGGIDLATYREARGVSIPWIHSSSPCSRLLLFVEYESACHWTVCLTTLTIHSS